MMAIILVLLFVFGNNPTFIGVAIALVVVYLVGLFVSQKKIKDKLNIESTKVVNDYFTNLDSYITRDTLFSDVKFNYEIKLPEDTFKNLRLFKDIYYVGGRDYIEGKFNDIYFVAGDNIIKTHGTKEDGSKQDYIVFLGKLFSFDKSLTSEGRAIIYLKGKSLNLPTDIDNLNVVEGILDDKFVVYSNFDVSNILNEIKEDLEKYSVNDQLLDRFISITEEKIGFAFSYADSVMSVPLLDPVNKEDLTRYTQDVDVMVDIMKKLAK